MTATWLRARAELRARWRGWLALVLLTGIFAGASIALAAGARRTHSAYPRFVEQTNAIDVLVPNLIFGPVWARFDLDALARHPLVEDSAHARLTFGEANGEVGLMAGDASLYTRLNVARILAGRLPDRAEPLEVSMPHWMALENGVTVGDTFTVGLATPKGPEEVTYDVVGIHVSAGDFPPFGTSPNLIGSPAFFERFRDRYLNFELLAVNLIDGSGVVDRFQAHLDDLADGRIVFTLDSANEMIDVQGAIGLQVVALWIIAAIAGISVILVMGQAVARQALLDTDDDAHLRSLGMAGGTLFGVSVVRGAVVAVASAVASAVVAVGLSPLMPRGVARVAEPRPGIVLDAVAIGPGAGIVLLAILGVSLLGGLRRARRSTMVAAQTRPTRIARLIRATRMQPPVATGVRFALEPGRGRTSVPVRTTVSSVALGLATLIATIIFSGNADRMLETPRLYGVVWDKAFSVDQGFDVEGVVPDLGPAAREVAMRPEVVAVTIGSQGVPMTLGSTPTTGLAFDQVKDLIAPPVLAGRTPKGDREIMVAPATMGRAELSLGDTVDLKVRGTDDGIPVTVVGVGVLPPLGANARFGEGVFCSYQLVRDVAALNPNVADFVPPPDEFYVRYAPGVDTAAVEADIRATHDDVLGSDFESIDVTEIVNFGGVRSLPAVLAAILGALAASTLVHGAVTGIRRRRRELAVLRTLGFVRRQVGTTIRWQASSLAVVTFLAALPAGVIVGRWGWFLFARTTGVVPEVYLPWHIGLVAPATLLVALLASMLPARAAARVRPAVVLRSE